MIVLVVKVTTQHIERGYREDRCPVIYALEADTGTEGWATTHITRAQTEDETGFHLIHDVRDKPSEFKLYKCDSGLFKWHRGWIGSRISDKYPNVEPIALEVDLLNRTAKLVAIGEAAVENYDRGGLGHGKQ